MRSTPPVCPARQRSPSLARLVAAVVTAVFVATGLSACSTDDGPRWTLPRLGPPDVDVDTPELRRAKRSAGIEQCPATTARDRDDTDAHLPALTLPCFGGGRAVDLQHLDGPRIVNLWASRCGQCAAEMPVLQAFHEAHHEQVPVLGVDYQDPQTGRAMSFLQETGVTFPQVADPGGVTNGAAPVPALRGLPLLLVIDEEGAVVHRSQVVVESVDELETLVSEALPGVLG